MADRDFMCGPVMFHDQWMIHGDIRRALFKITYGITTGGHHVAEQSVGLAYGTFGVINKLCLNLAPGRDTTVPVAWRERTDCETLNAFFSLLEPGFPFPVGLRFPGRRGYIRVQIECGVFLFCAF